MKSQIASHIVQKHRMPVRALLVLLFAQILAGGAAYKVTSSVTAALWLDFFLVFSPVFLFGQFRTVSADGFTKANVVYWPVVLLPLLSFISYNWMVGSIIAGICIMYAYYTFLYMPVPKGGSQESQYSGETVEVVVILADSHVMTPDGPREQGPYIQGVRDVGNTSVTADDLLNAARPGEGPGEGHPDNRE